MKHLSLFIVTSLLLLVSCQEKKSKKSSVDCNLNYYQQGCPGYNPYTTTGGGTTGTFTQHCASNPTYNWTTPGCPGFCQNNTTHSSCGSGTTTGTTTGGTTGTIGNPYSPVYSSALVANWGQLYPGGEPSGSCSSAYAQNGISYTPYETRKATMSIVGGRWYNPADADAPHYINTSPKLKSVTEAHTLFSTDSVLKVRFKVLPQPPSGKGITNCYRQTQLSTIAGYTKLQYSVSLVGKKTNGATETVPLGTFLTGVNSCTPSIDLSSYASTYPSGIYLIVQSVQGNQLYFPDNYQQYGFRDVNSFKVIRDADCWALDVEVAADGTKTFD